MEDISDQFNLMREELLRYDISVLNLTSFFDDFAGFNSTNRTLIFPNIIFDSNYDLAARVTPDSNLILTNRKDPTHQGIELNKFDSKTIYDRLPKRIGKASQFRINPNANLVITQSEVPVNPHKILLSLDKGVFFEDIYTAPTKEDYYLLFQRS